MKKIIYYIIFILLLQGITANCEPNSENSEKNETTNTTNTTETKDEIKSTDTTKPEYITVKKGTETFYYDKYGKLISREKYVKPNNFFYNANGQCMGKSVERLNKTYYYTQTGLFLGVCDDKGECFDKDFVSIGKIPPLPIVKNNIPYFDEELLKPQAQKSKDEDE